MNKSMGLASAWWMNWFRGVVINPSLSNCLSTGSFAMAVSSFISCSSTVVRWVNRVSWWDHTIIIPTSFLSPIFTFIRKRLSKTAHHVKCIQYYLFRMICISGLFNECQKKSQPILNLEIGQGWSAKTCCQRHDDKSTTVIAITH
jgi:hypothetical protein